ncbi:MAG TPA: SemiSWEET family transporter [Jatrophihabitans sp.]|nr:SemiSWEET family transporter [Jatrophihabitans sp.]
MLAVAAFAPLPDAPADAAPTHERVSKGHVLVVAVLALTAASWAVLMGVAPLLQLRRMIQRRSSADVSIGYLLILLPGFALWVGYGLASGNPALVVPNSVAFVVAAVTVICAVRLRRRRAGTAVPGR